MRNSLTAGTPGDGYLVVLVSQLPHVFSVEPFLEPDYRPQCRTCGREPLHSLHRPQEPL